MNVAVFAGLVSAITVVAAMSLLGAVALMLTASRKRPSPPAQDVLSDPYPLEGESSVVSADTLNPGPRQRWTAHTPALHGHGAGAATPIEDRPTTPVESTKPRTPPSRPSVVRAGLRAPSSVPPSAPLRGPRSLPVRPSAEQFFEDEEEGEEYGVSTFDPLLRPNGATPDWTEEEGSTEIFSAHNSPEAEYAFAEFEEVPTRVGTQQEKMS